MEYADLIGIPFAYNGRSDKALDCYGLVIELYRRLGIELPDYRAPVDGNAQIIAGMMFEAERTVWKPCSPTPGCLIYMRIGLYDWHVGVYLGDDQIIHTSEATGGVCTDRLSTFRNQIKGFYEYAGE